VIKAFRQQGNRLARDLLLIIMTLIDLAVGLGLALENLLQAPVPVGAIHTQNHPVAAVPAESNPGPLARNPHDIATEVLTILVVALATVSPTLIHTGPMLISEIHTGPTIQINPDTLVPLARDQVPQKHLNVLVPLDVRHNGTRAPASPHDYHHQAG